jgi:preprotein translocase SecE subunit
MLLQIYKPGQGKYTRLCSGFVVAIIVAMGCWRLYEKLDAAYENLWLVTMIPAGLCVAAAVAIFWLLNKAVLADFMIAAEGELKKVNWSSRREVAVSTVIVIVVVIAMAVLLGTTDVVFQLVFSHLLG